MKRGCASRDAALSSRLSGPSAVACAGHLWSPLDSRPAHLDCPAHSGADLGNCDGGQPVAMPSHAGGKLLCSPSRPACVPGQFPAALSRRDRLSHSSLLDSRERRRRRMRSQPWHIWLAMATITRSSCETEIQRSSSGLTDAARERIVTVEADRKSIASLSPDKRK
jgi:hypothetical protein